MTEKQAQKAASIVSDMETLLKKEYRHTDADMIITWKNLHRQWKVCLQSM